MLHKKKFDRLKSITHTSGGFLHPVNPIRKKEYICLGISLGVLALCLLMVTLAKSNPAITEKYFSLGFYKIWAGAISWVTSLVPFSIAEGMLVLFAIGVIGFVVTLIRQLCLHRHFMGRVFARFGIWLACATSVVMLLLTMGCLPNYYRNTFTMHSDLSIVPTTVDELVLVCEELVATANTQRDLVSEDENQVASYAPITDREMAKLSRDSYGLLIEENPQWTEIFSLSARTTPKPVVLSEAMSYAQLLGFFFPFTMEANVNVHTVDIEIPSTMCHELAHISGFMREDEANFIAYLACNSSDDDFVQYSGTMLALVHATNALYSQDADRYHEVMALLSSDVKRDMDADSAYYQAHDTSFGDFSRVVNDTYLKVNNQTDGVQSYGRMVDLLIADYNTRHGL